MSPLEKGVEDRRRDSWVSFGCVHPFPEGLELGVPVFNRTGIGAMEDMSGIFQVVHTKGTYLSIPYPIF